MKNIDLKELFTVPSFDSRADKKNQKLRQGYNWKTGKFCLTPINPVLPDRDHYNWKTGFFYDSKGIKIDEVPKCLKGYTNQNSLEDDQ